MNGEKVPSIILKQAINLIESLPEDNADRQWAQSLINKEYGNCKTLEKKFNSLWLGQPIIDNFENYYYVCDYLCEKVNVPYISFIRKEAEACFGGLYFAHNKTIALQPNAPIVDLLHELSHHIVLYNPKCLNWWRKFRLPNEGYHGKGFLAVENYLFKYILNLQSIYSSSYKRGGPYDAKCICHMCRPYSLVDLIIDSATKKPLRYTNRVAA